MIVKRKGSFLETGKGIVTRVRTRCDWRLDLQPSFALHDGGLVGRLPVGKPTTFVNAGLHLFDFVGLQHVRRRPTGRDLGRVVIDSIEELGLGLVVSASFLFLLGRIAPGDSVREIMGKIIVEALLIAIGISIGTSQMVDAETEDCEERERGAKPKDILGVLSLSACGAVVLATNIAITDEVVLIGVQSHPWQLVGMVTVSLLLGALVMVFSDLLENGSSSRISFGFRLVYGSVVSYAVAFVCSATILFLLGRFDGMAVAACLAMTVVLTVAASMGAAAGKLLIR